jgi:hypothetical protein
VNKEVRKMRARDAPQQDGSSVIFAHVNIDLF